MYAPFKYFQNILAEDQTCCWKSGSWKQ